MHRLYLAYFQSTQLTGDDGAYGQLTDRVSPKLSPGTVLKRRHTVCASIIRRRT